MDDEESMRGGDGDSQGSAEGRGAAGGGTTGNRGGDDSDFDRILGGTADNILEDDEKSEPEDPEDILKYNLRAQREKRAHEKSQVKERRVRRVVVGKGLPNQSTALCRSIQNFTRFIMGMPESISAYPAPPDQEEWEVWNNWTENRYKKLTKHLEEFSEKNKNLAKSVFQKVYQDEVSRIRKHLSPPSFTAAPDILSTELDVPLSIKKACEQDLQIAGFGRLTFEWQASSFNSSSWNASLATIVIKHYFNWAKSKPGVMWGEVGCMEQILDRWVRGQGKEIRRAHQTNGQSPEDLKAEKSRKAAISRMKVKMKAEPNLAVLFSKEAVSDWEDQPVPAKPKRIQLAWRSEAFSLCSHKLDEIAITVAKTTTEMKTIHKLVDRSPELITNSTTPLAVIPRRLPIDAYDATFLQSLSQVEKDHLDPQKEIGLEAKAWMLNQMTMRIGPGASQIPRGSIGDLGIGNLPGPSTGS
ncbi:hypothetical protein PGT21_018126 [Puccinia graminis f. sp. tritici]|uniref:Uncharacterized protein n=1 Tax=Puccinia graminis f. sp. tritici TaxID=56615 RepID=A0A5B0MD04_PUCGR|nr:hypothetical protein PGT21_018126 [Puccinia graminis f. sp. tritici]